MTNISEILQNIRNLSGNIQIDEIKKHKNNLLLKEVLFYTYNKMLKFKVSDKKFNNVDSKKRGKFQGTHQLDEDFWNHFKTKLDYLSTAKGCKNVDILELIDNIDHLEKKEDKLILKQVIVKDLRLNIGSSTINKIWTGLIPDTNMNSDISFKVTKLENHTDPEELPFIVNYLSRKFDGHNSTSMKIVILENGVILGRSGKEITKYPVLLKQIQLLDIDNYVYMGEIVYLDDLGNDDLDKVGDKLLFNDVYLVLYDRISRDKFINQEETGPYNMRFEDLSYELKVHKHDTFWDRMYSETKFDKILLAENMLVDKDRYIKMVKLAKDKGWEGLVIRNNVSYEYKRTKNIVRYKPRQDSEFKIKGFNEGEKGNVGTLGSIIIELENGDTVKVGTGYSAQLSDDIWSKRDEILNRKDLLCKVSFRKRSKNKKGGTSLTEPSFKGFRLTDMTEISIKEI